MCVDFGKANKKELAGYCDKLDAENFSEPPSGAEHCPGDGYERSKM